MKNSPRSPMRGRWGPVLVMLWFGAVPNRCGALEPSEILIVANETNQASTRIAEYYCDKRGLSREQILRLPLPQPLAGEIERTEYLRTIAEPVRKAIQTPTGNGRIRCLLTVYGIPYRIAVTRDPAAVAIADQLGRIRQNRIEYLIQIANRLQDPELKMTPTDPKKTPRIENIVPRFPEQFENSLKQIQSIFDPQTRRKGLDEWAKLYIEVFGKPAGWKKAEELGIELTVAPAEPIAVREDLVNLQKARNENWSPVRRFEAKLYDAFERVAGTSGLIAAIDSDLILLQGRETGAALDSELTMVLFGDYSLYRWQPNELKELKDWTETRTLMVCRLDGPDEKIVVGLIDKALTAERNGIQGVAYFDARSPDSEGNSPNPLYDRSIRRAADIVRKKTKLTVVEDHTSELFAPGSSPNAAIYCGWYSLEKYVDAFDFVPGAVGYHIASFEAFDLRGKTSTQWCPAMLRDGITATLGPVYEPYLTAFPLPEEFFRELLDGRCLVEAYFRTNPFNSWQMLLIGDPLYRPFSIRQSALSPSKEPPH